VSGRSRVQITWPTKRNSRAGRVAQEVECLICKPNKCESVSSNPSTFVPGCGSWFFIPSTQEVEIERITFQGQPREKVSEPPHVNKQAKRDGAHLSS
jgi:hypothetical protein